MYPVYLKLTNRIVLVVGAGPVATRKVEALLEAGASVTVVSPEATDEIRQLALNDDIVWKRRRFHRADLRPAFLVITATSEPAVNDMVYRIADRRRLLVNSVDDPDHCNFYVPAVVRRDPLILSISTSGRAPVFAKHLKRFLDRKLYAEIGNDVEELGRLRDAVLSDADGLGQQERLEKISLSQDANIRNILERIDKA